MITAISAQIHEEESLALEIMDVIKEFYRNGNSLLVVFMMVILLILSLPLPSSWAGGVGRAMDPQLQEEYCKNFTYGNGRTEFFSPGFPRNYPAGIKCFRTISADYGYFVRVDFRDYFNIEPPTNEGHCDYDYLEVSPVTKKCRKSSQKIHWSFIIQYPFLLVTTF